MEDIKKNQMGILELKNTIDEKKSLKELKSRLKMAEERANELEDR